MTMKMVSLRPKEPVNLKMEFSMPITIQNVRLVDYHRKWRAYYLQNNWFYDEKYQQNQPLIKPIKNH